MISKLKALTGCSSHHLQRQGHTVAASLQAAQLLVNIVCFSSVCYQLCMDSEWFKLFMHRLVYFIPIRVKKDLKTFLFHGAFNLYQYFLLFFNFLKIILYVLCCTALLNIG